MEGIFYVYKLELSSISLKSDSPAPTHHLWHDSVGVLSTSPLHVAVDPVFRMGGFRATLQETFRHHTAGLHG